MERLTFEGNFCDLAMCRENPCPYNGSCSQRETWERLKAYEDTGLTPEICSEYKKFEDEAVGKGVPFSRIVELMEAERDGLLVVLPCKVGDTVWVVFANGILPYVVDRINVISHNQAQVRVRMRFMVTETLYLTGDNFGKTVFRTKEEAEAALQKEETP